MEGRKGAGRFYLPLRLSAFKVCIKASCGKGSRTDENAKKIRIAKGAWPNEKDRTPQSYRNKINGENQQEWAFYSVGVLELLLQKSGS